MTAQAWTIVAIIALAIVLLIAAFLVRLRFLAGQVGSFECAWRAGPRWFSGVAAFRHESLDWYRLMSLSLRPTRSWSRLELELLEARHRRAQGRVVDVVCADPSGRFELAMMDESYSALISWVESAAPEQPRLF
ncbi:DUF2550 domain-containing protein [Actinomyces slackii]|uniref:Protein of uncharacterized function (DUF2550) n=1 Tax=Actinomyces slackii TaxID=52774 RepID=A0A448KC83_9ACTO|nr:DUF2550 domain-containing protein [Actinomyces slackii]VEG74536.1 Protein of uncharacterised function (DUF2550) [Actinomyces slackii]